MIRGRADVAFFVERLRLGGGIVGVHGDERDPIVACGPGHGLGLGKRGVDFFGAA